jgi:ABC-type dipeptide/oligopeptide/nickel transport system permease subunit
MKNISIIKRCISRTIIARIIVGCMLGIIIFLVLFGRYITPNAPYKTDLSNTMRPPSSEYIFGTDNLGRCVFSRVLAGAHISILSALAVVIITFTAGTAIGLIAGYTGGFADALLMRITTIFQAFPPFLLAVAVAGMLGPSLRNGIIALAFSYWTTYARLVKSLVVSIKNDLYIKAAQVCGAKKRHIILRHILPNIIPPVIITAVSDISSVILQMAGLAFIGLSVQRPSADWGLMMSETRTYLQLAPWSMIFPGEALLLVVITFNLFGDQLRGLLDEKSHPISG